MNKLHNIFLTVTAVGIVLQLAVIGCISTPDGIDWKAVIKQGYETVYDIREWDRAQRQRDKAQGGSEIDPTPTPENPETPDTGDPGKDFAAYSDFIWKYGGENFAKAVNTGKVAISLKGLHASRIDYSWDRDLSGWGIGRDNADAVVAAFVVDSNGQWVGGKFDWTSTSRKSRGFSHLAGAKAYKGWNLDGIPNPTKLAFVVVRRDGKERSNVIGGDWKR